MAARALDFCTANPSDQASSKSVVARLDALVNRADALSVQQRSGKVNEDIARAERSAIRDTVRREHLRQLVRIAASAVKEHPELKQLFRLPKFSGPNHDFLTAAKDMLGTATAQKPLLDSLGLGETFIDDLTQGIAGFEKATEAGHIGRSARVGASAGLDEIASEVLTVVGVLDGMNQVRFKGDPELLAAWNSASKVAGPFKKAAEAPVPAPTPAPAPTAADGGETQAAA